MQERGITEALAYDDHFYQASFILCVTVRYRLALHGVATPVQKRKGWSSMPQRSSGSVKVFYPPWTREALLVRLREGVAALRQVLPLVRGALWLLCQGQTDGRQ